MFEKLTPPNLERIVTEKWKYKDKIYISIVCPCFNQELYIKDAVDSFLSQETEYRFEIIIHDDASTDGTRDILLEYKKKYPSIIKLILQEENQYSQGKQIAPLGVEHADGEYIALCEGDDFWIDKHKLQKQIVKLEKNKDINICFTAAYGLYSNGKVKLWCNYIKDQIFKLDSIILGGGAFMPTASIMIKKDIFNKLPDWFYSIAPVGDYYLQMLSGVKGAYYLHDTCVVYREMSNGSWSMTRKLKTEDNINHEYDRHLSCINSFFKSNIDFSDLLKEQVLANIKLKQAYELARIGSLYSSYKLYIENYKISVTSEKWLNFVKKHPSLFYLYIFLLSIK